jgi:uncharacterized protein YdcH (DUF465 family)
MSKNRDPLTLTGYTDEQLKTIRRIPRIVQLRKERLRLRDEMRSLARTIKAAERPYPELYRQHNEICKKLTRIKKALRDKAKKNIKKGVLRYHAQKRS